MGDGAYPSGWPGGATRMPGTPMLPSVGPHPPSCGFCTTCRDGHRAERLALPGPWGRSTPYLREGWGGSAHHTWVPSQGETGGAIRRHSTVTRLTDVTRGTCSAAACLPPAPG